MSAIDLEAFDICATSIATSPESLGAGPTHTRCQYSQAKPRLLGFQHTARKTRPLQSLSDSQKVSAQTQEELISHFVVKTLYQLIDNRKTLNTFFSINERLRSVEFLPMPLEKLYFHDTMRSFHMNRSIEQ